MANTSTSPRIPAAAYPRRPGIDTPKTVGLVLANRRSDEAMMIAAIMMLAESLLRDLPNSVVQSSRPMWRNPMWNWPDWTLRSSSVVSLGSERSRRRICQKLVVVSFRIKEGE